MRIDYMDNRSNRQPIQSTHFRHLLHLSAPPSLFIWLRWCFSLWNSGSGFSFINTQYLKNIKQQDVEQRIMLLYMAKYMAQEYVVQYETGEDE